MSSLAAAPPLPAGLALWRRQAWAVVRLELGKIFSAWGSLALLFLGFAPVPIIAIHAREHGSCNLQTDTMVLASIVQFFYARVAIFFGCLAIAMRAVRGDVAEKTLHYVFLAPVRRDVLIVGKFLAGVLTAIAVFGGGVLACFALMYAHFPAGRAFLAHGPGLAHLASYLLVVALACLGYSAIFLALSLLFKNPALPAMVFLLWETLNAILPPWLKHLSVTFYLKSLYPVELPFRGFASLFSVVAEPTPPWLAVAGLVAFSGVVLGFACWSIRRFEVSYSVD